MFFVALGILNYTNDCAAIIFITNGIPHISPSTFLFIHTSLTISYLHW